MKEPRQKLQNKTEKMIHKQQTVQSLQCTELKPNTQRPRIRANKQKEGPVREGLQIREQI